MPSLFAAAPALVPCLSASSPDVIVAPTFVPCPSASALACCRCCRRHLSLARQRPRLPSSTRWLSSLACQCPPLPAVVIAAATTDSSGRARQIIAVRHRPRRPAAALAVPSTSVNQRRHNQCCHRALFATALATKSRAFWAKYFFTYRGINSPGSKKQKSS
jgi:hypothetical protein